MHFVGTHPQIFSNLILQSAEDGLHLYFNPLTKEWQKLKQSPSKKFIKPALATLLELAKNLKQANQISAQDTSKLASAFQRMWQKKQTKQKNSTLHRLIDKIVDLIKNFTTGLGFKPTEQIYEATQELLKAKPKTAVPAKPSRPMPPIMPQRANSEITKTYLQNIQFASQTNISVPIEAMKTDHLANYIEDPQSCSEFSKNRVFKDIRITDLETEKKAFNKNEKPTNFISLLRLLNNDSSISLKSKAALQGVADALQYRSSLEHTSFLNWILSQQTTSATLCEKIIDQFLQRIISATVNIYDVKLVAVKYFKNFTNQNTLEGITKILHLLWLGFPNDDYTISLTKEVVNRKDVDKSFLEAGIKIFENKNHPDAHYPAKDSLEAKLADLTKK